MQSVTAAVTPSVAMRSARNVPGGVMAISGWSYSDASSIPLAILASEFKQNSTGLFDALVDVTRRARRSVSRPPLIGIS